MNDKTLRIVVDTNLWVSMAMMIEVLTITNFLEKAK